MAVLIIREGSERMGMRLPHLIMLNGQAIGILGTVGKDAYKEMLRPNQPARQAEIRLPAGSYRLRIQSMLRWFSSEATITVTDDQPTIVTFSDQEKYWDILFCIDIIAWILKLILHIGRPWSIVYEVLSDGFFVVWLIHEIRIRKRYFQLQISH